MHDEADQAWNEHWRDRLLLNIGDIFCICVAFIACAFISWTLWHSQ
jgi:hypothetical protein